MLQDAADTADGWWRKVLPHMEVQAVPPDLPDAATGDEHDDLLPALPGGLLVPAGFEDFEHPA
eukprot:2098854-Karenia_brevis.AAC.1